MRKINEPDSYFNLERSIGTWAPTARSLICYNIIILYRPVEKKNNDDGDGGITREYNIIFYTREEDLRRPGAPSSDIE